VLEKARQSGESEFRNQVARKVTRNKTTWSSHWYSTAVKQAMSNVSVSLHNTSLNTGSGGEWSQQINHVDVCQVRLWFIRLYRAESLTRLILSELQVWYVRLCRSKAFDYLQPYTTLVATSLILEHFKHNITEKLNPGAR